jgi:hypothetical protein
MKALVLSAETPSACAVVRGLHAVGFEVTAMAQAWHSPAALSRSCAKSWQCGEWLSSALPGIVASVGPDVVVPATEGDLARLAPVRAEVEAKAKVLAPTPAALDESTDKVFTSKAAELLGVAIPEQWIFGAGDTAFEPPSAFPFVAKPARSRVLRPDGTVWGATAAWVPDLPALVAVHAANAAAGLDTIVQRPVAGTALLASVLVREDGDPSLAFVHQRVREARPEGGPSAWAVSVAPEPRLVDPAVRLAHALHLVGVPVQFEFRVRPDGTPVLLDVNPRPWGTLGLALDCGINFYGLAARHLLGDRLPAPPPPYRAGITRHYLPFELRHAWAVAFGEPQRGYPGPWPDDKLHAAVDWVFAPSDGLVGKLDDPLPAIGDAVRLVARALQGRKG